MFDKLRPHRLALLVMAWCAFLIVLVCGFAAGLLLYIVLFGTI